MNVNTLFVVLIIALSSFSPLATAQVGGSDPFRCSNAEFGIQIPGSVEYDQATGTSFCAAGSAFLTADSDVPFCTPCGDSAAGYVRRASAASGSVTQGELCSACASCNANSAGAVDLILLADRTGCACPAGLECLSGNCDIEIDVEIDLCTACGPGKYSDGTTRSCSACDSSTHFAADNNGVATDSGATQCCDSTFGCDLDQSPLKTPVKGCGSNSYAMTIALTDDIAGKIAGSDSVDVFVTSGAYQSAVWTLGANSASQDVEFTPLSGTKSLNLVYEVRRDGALVFDGASKFDLTQGWTNCAVFAVGGCNGAVSLYSTGDSDMTFVLETPAQAGVGLEPCDQPDGCDGPVDGNNVETITVKPCGDGTGKVKDSCDNFYVVAAAGSQYTDFNVWSYSGSSNTLVLYGSNDNSLACSCKNINGATCDPQNPPTGICNAAQRTCSVTYAPSTDKSVYEPQYACANGNSQVTIESLVSDGRFWKRGVSSSTDNKFATAFNPSQLNVEPSDDGCCQCAVFDLQRGPCSEPAACSHDVAVSGELWTRDFFSFGDISWNSQADSCPGCVSSVYTIHGLGSTDEPVYQIVFQFAGENTNQVRLNILKRDTDGNDDGSVLIQKTIGGDFDWTDAHDYKISWASGKVEWSIDGQVVQTYDNADKIPQSAARLQAHSWGTAAGDSDFVAQVGVYASDTADHQFKLCCPQYARGEECVADEEKPLPEDQTGVCAPGRYGANNVCEDCQTGRFTSQYNEQFCRQCPKGTYLDSTGNSVCTDCPVGTYQDQIARTSCINCQDASRCQETGLSWPQDPAVNSEAAAKAVNGRSAELASASLVCDADDDDVCAPSSFVTPKHGFEFELRGPDCGSTVEIGENVRFELITHGRGLEKRRGKFEWVAVTDDDETVLRVDGVAENGEALCEKNVLNTDQLDAGVNVIEVRYYTRSHHKKPKRVVSRCLTVSGGSPANGDDYAIPESDNRCRFGGRKFEWQDTVEGQSPNHNHKFPMSVVFERRTLTDGKSCNGYGKSDKKVGNDKDGFKGFSTENMRCRITNDNQEEIKVVEFDWEEGESVHRLDFELDLKEKFGEECKTKTQFDYKLWFQLALDGEQFDRDQSHGNNRRYLHLRWKCPTGEASDDDDSDDDGGNNGNSAVEITECSRPLFGDKLDDSCSPTDQLTFAQNDANDACCTTYRGQCPGSVPEGWSTTVSRAVKAANHTSSSKAAKSHAFWLPNLASGGGSCNIDGSGDSQWVFAAGSQYVETDTTLTLTGTIYSQIAPDAQFDVAVQFSSPVRGAIPQPSNGSPKQELSSKLYKGKDDGFIDPSEWNYWRVMDSGVLTGKGTLAGASANLALRGPAYQEGVGANGKNTDNGASTWFTVTINSQPTAAGCTLNNINGDINIDVLDYCEVCVPFTPEEPVEVCEGVDCPCEGDDCPCEGDDCPCTGPDCDACDEVCQCPLTEETPDANGQGADDGEDNDENSLTCAAHSQAFVHTTAVVSYTRGTDSLGELVGNVFDEAPENVFKSDWKFWSLGYGGDLTVATREPFTGTLNIEYARTYVFETTAKAYVLPWNIDIDSATDNQWVLAGSISSMPGDGSYNFKILASLSVGDGCYHAVRLVDTSSTPAYGIISSIVRGVSVASVSAKGKCKCGCTRSQGHYRTKSTCAGFGSGSSDGAWAAAFGAQGEDADFFGTGKSLCTVLAENPSSDERCQYIAAKLNAARSGVFVPKAVKDELDLAASCFAAAAAGTALPTGCANLDGSKFQNFNDGKESGPGQCNGDDGDDTPDPEEPKESPIKIDIEFDETRKAVTVRACAPYQANGKLHVLLSAADVDTVASQIAGGVVPPSSCFPTFDATALTKASVQATNAECPCVINSPSNANWDPSNPMWNYESNGACGVCGTLRVPFDALSECPGGATTKVYTATQTAVYSKVVAVLDTPDCQPKQIVNSRSFAFAIGVDYAIVAHGTNEKAEDLIDVALENGERLSFKITPKAAKVVGVTASAEGATAEGTENGAFKFSADGVAKAYSFNVDVGSAAPVVVEVKLGQTGSALEGFDDLPTGDDDDDDDSSAMMASSPTHIVGLALLFALALIQ